MVSYPDLDAVNPGRLLFGWSFDAHPSGRVDWHSAIVGLKSRLVMRKSLADLGDIEPAPFFHVRPGMVLGFIPFGWGDGFPRMLPDDACALIWGRRARFLGPPHSELLRVDLTDVPDAALGDEVMLMGRSGDLEISPAELCRQWGMSLAELYATLPAHVPRRYLAG